MNGDYRKDIADVRCLRNWLIARPNGVMRDPEATDMNGDGVLDPKDLSLLKRMILPAYSEGE